MIVDTHLHVWELGRFAYPWLTSESSALCRDHTVEQALEVMRATGVEGAVLVEANNSLDEARWLLEITEAHEEILGVVGWCDLASPTLERDLEPLVRHTKFRGVRPTLPAPSADRAVWQAFEPGFEVLGSLNLSCDLLVQHGLHRALEFVVGAHPKVRFVLDHFGGAAISSETHAAWAKSLEPYAVFPNVTLKLSGFLTASGQQPLASRTLELFVNTALEMFGPERLMFGSDWPICTLRGSYAEAKGLLERSLNHLDARALDHIFGGTAMRVYQLEPMRSSRRVATMT